MFMCKEERLQMLAFWFARGKKNVEYFEVNVGMKLFFFLFCYLIIIIKYMYMYLWKLSVSEEGEESTLIAY